MNGQPDRTDFSEIIAENFGANATYVEGLLDRFRSNPELVDESWRVYFTEMLGTAPVPAAVNDNGGTSRVTATAPAPASSSGGNGASAATGAQAGAATAPSNAQPTSTVQQPPAAQSAAPATQSAPAIKVEAAPIRGGALTVSYTHLTLPTTPYV